MVFVAVRRSVGWVLFLVMWLLFWAAAAVGTIVEWCLEEEV
jgi:hypothetical protein